MAANTSKSACMALDLGEQPPGLLKRLSLFSDIKAECRRLMTAASIARLVIGQPLRAGAREHFVQRADLTSMFIAV